MSKYKITLPGMRNIKTAFAVFCSLELCALLQTNYPFYAAVTTVIVMQSDIANTINTGFNRLAGTFAGGILGGVFLQTLGHIRKIQHFLYYFLVSIGISLLIYLMTLIKWPGAVAVSCVVFIGIVITLNTDVPPYLFALQRIVDTSIGVVVAVLVNLLLPFENYKKEGKLRDAKLLLRKPVSADLADESKQIKKTLAAPKKIENPRKKDYRSLYRIKKQDKSTHS